MKKPMYIYQKIQLEEKNFLNACEGLPIRGKRTSPDTVKWVKNTLSKICCRLSRYHNVLLTYPLMSIQGCKVVLGPAYIMLPNCRIVNIDQLKEIELNGGSKRV